MGFNWTTALRMAAWGMQGFIAYATLSQIEARPTVSEASYEHVAAFAVLALLACAAYRAYWMRAVAVVIGMACVLEYAQTFVPGRHARLSDLADKGLGIAIGVLAFWLIEGVLQRLRANRG